MRTIRIAFHAALILGIFRLAIQAQTTTATGTALVRHAPALSGTVEGSVQQMMGENIILNGGSVLTNDLLVPGSPALLLNGKPTFSGTVTGSGAVTPSGYSVTLNGNARLGRLVKRTDPLALDISSLI